MNRKKLLKILDEQVDNKNIIKHMIATEACMEALAKYLEEDNIEEWRFAGLMHDGDYKDSVPVEKQGIKITEMLRDRGVKVPESVAQAMAAHNHDNTGIEPETKMDWALTTCDSLTGLIVATALVLPDKKLEDVTVETAMNRFKEPKFAAGTRREEIRLCEEKLGIELKQFIEICLGAMQDVSDELGL